MIVGSASLRTVNEFFGGVNLENTIENYAAPPESDFAKATTPSGSKGFSAS